MDKEWGGVAEGDKEKVTSGETELRKEGGEGEGDGMRVRRGER